MMRRPDEIGCGSVESVHEEHTGDGEGRQEGRPRKASRFGDRPHRLGGSLYRP
jgi:hypothetical protein